MSEKLKKLWEEIKDYVVTNQKTYELELVKDAPKEIKKKFEQWINMADDEIILQSKNTSTQKK